MKWFVGLASFSLLFSYEDVGLLFTYYVEDKAPAQVKEEKFIPTYFAQAIEAPPELLSTNEQIEELRRRLDAIEKQTALGEYGVSTTTATPRVCGREWIASSDVLYWHAHLESTQYAARRSTSSNPTQDTNTTETLNFPWNFGFRLGLGTVVKEERWDVNAQFTYFVTTAEDIARDYPQTTLTPLWTGLVDTTSYDWGKSTLWIRYSDVVVDLGRNYFISSQLSVRPNFAVRSTWIREKRMNLFDLGGSDPLNSTDSSYMWGIGPRIGTSGRWFLANGFHFTSSFGMSFLYSYFQLRHLDTLFADPDDLTRVKETKHRYIPCADLFLGIGWGTYVNEQQQFLHFELGYDLQYFWNQNQFIQVLPKASANAREQYQNANDDLSFSGLTAKVQLNF